MTPRERTKQLYRQHRVCKCLNEGTAQAIHDAIVAAVAEERERCAKVAEEYIILPCGKNELIGQEGKTCVEAARGIRTNIAAAIREGAKEER